MYTFYTQKRPHLPWSPQNNGNLSHLFLRGKPNDCLTAPRPFHNVAVHHFSCSTDWSLLGLGTSRLTWYRCYRCQTFVAKIISVPCLPFEASTAEFPWHLNLDTPGKPRNLGTLPRSPLMSFLPLPLCKTPVSLWGPRVSSANKSPWRPWPIDFDDLLFKTVIYHRIKIWAMDWQIY